MKQKNIFSWMRVRSWLIFLTTVGAVGVAPMAFAGVFAWTREFAWHIPPRLVPIFLWIPGCLIIVLGSAALGIGATWRLWGRHAIGGTAWRWGVLGGFLALFLFLAAALAARYGVAQADNTRIRDLANIKIALTLYYDRSGTRRYPPLGSACQDATALESYLRPYIPRVPSDPWVLYNFPDYRVWVSDDGQHVVLRAMLWNAREGAGIPQQLDVGPGACACGGREYCTEL